MCEHTCHGKWRGEDNSRGQFSPSTKWGPRDGTWVVRFLYLLGPLNCPEFLSITVIGNQ